MARFVTVRTARNPVATMLSVIRQHSHKEFLLRKGTIMNKFISSVFAAALSLGAYSAMAATTSASKMMDTNNDDVVSKDEYMTYHGQAYDNMKQANGGVSVKSLRSWMKSGSYTSSMNNKPIGTTTGVSNNGSTDDTKVGEPINGTTTGTNN